MTGVSGVAASSVVTTGAALAARVASADPAMLDDHDLLDLIADTERVLAWAASMQFAAAAEFARRPAREARPGEDPEAARATYAPPGVRVREFADEEVAARLRCSRIAAAHKVGLGCALVRLPATCAALAAGRIDVGRARVIVEQTSACDPWTAREIESAVIERAARLPAARLREVVRREVLRADPLAARVRAAKARADRTVWMQPLPEGMAEVAARLTATEAVTVKTALSAAATAMKADRAPDDRRTMDQLLADAFVAPFARALATGVLDGATPVKLAKHRGQAATLQVTVAASTLLGHDDAPAQLSGYGPITADIARELAPDSRMRRLLTDPHTGAVLDVGTTTYRPPAPIARHVEARDVRCTAPGCGWAATACEIDHIVPFPLGPTSANNGAPRCPRHHHLKHSPGVDCSRNADGTTVWTMPTGHNYRVELPAVGALIPHLPDDPHDSATDATFPAEHVLAWNDEVDREHTDYGPSG